MKKILKKIIKALILKKLSGTKKRSIYQPKRTNKFRYVLKKIID